jgi:hypothetical protein
VPWYWQALIWSRDVQPLNGGLEVMDSLVVDVTRFSDSRILVV